MGVREYSVWVDGLGVGSIGVGLTQTTTTWSLALRPGQAYTVNVRAWDATFNGSPTARLSVTTVPDTTAPTVPSGLTVSAVTASTALLGWSSSTDGWSSSTDAVGPIEYEIRVNGAIIKVVPSGGSRTIADTEVLGANVITLVAVDEAGNASAPSNSIQVTTNWGFGQGC